MTKLKNERAAYAVITFGALVGFIASFWQLIEKIQLLKHPHEALSCNLSPIFNCSNILNAHQSSVFGFPNSMLCLTLFAIALSAGLIGLAGGVIHKYLRFFFQLLALFTAGFGFWYLWQSIFNVGAICIFCIFCYGGVLLLNGAWFRINCGDYPVAQRLGRWLVAKGADIFFWILIALTITLEAIIKFHK